MENKTELAKEVIRKSFVMSVAPDKQNEYKLRHDNIWPELEKALKAVSYTHLTLPTKRIV